jgi:hypothetical protein
MTISITSIVLTILLFTLIISHTFHNWIVKTPNSSGKSGIAVAYGYVLFVIYVITVILFE